MSNAFIPSWCNSPDHIRPSRRRFSTSRANYNGEVQNLQRVALIGISDWHCGQFFVVGSAGDGERFSELAAPVKVEVFAPTNPFERE